MRIIHASYINHGGSHVHTQFPASEFENKKKSYRTSGLDVDFWVMDPNTNLLRKIDSIKRTSSLVSPTEVPFVKDDGGRAAAGYRGTAGDCVVRSIAIATESPYQEIYDIINSIAKKEMITKRRKDRSNARNGVYRSTYSEYLSSIGWKWVPTMSIGSGCKVHLRPDELPSGRLIVSVSKHMTAFVNGVLHDTHDISRQGLRCVYGYWEKG